MEYAILKGKFLPSRVTGEMVDATSGLLNGRGIGVRLRHYVSVRDRLEACHDGPPCPMLVPQCASPGEAWIGRNVADGSLKAREALC